MFPGEGENVNVSPAVWGVVMLILSRFFAELDIRLSISALMEEKSPKILKGLILQNVQGSWNDYRRIHWPEQMLGIQAKRCRNVKSTVKSCLNE